MGVRAASGGGGKRRARNTTPPSAQHPPAGNPHGDSAAGQNVEEHPGLKRAGAGGGDHTQRDSVGRDQRNRRRALQSVAGHHHRGGGTLLAVAKGSRVQAYVDGQPGPVVNAIPVTQTLVQPKWGDSTNGSPQSAPRTDGARVAYIVDLDNNKHAVVVDGTMSPAYDQD